MALRFVDPDATTTAEVDGVKFTIGYWPPREAERVEALRAALRKCPNKDTEEARGIGLEVHLAMVEYGVRAFDGQPADAFVRETVRGIEYTRVSSKVLRQLYINDAIWPLGVACLQWNELSELEKKVSG